VPGPQFELFLLGRALSRLYPVVPIAQAQALGIAIMSYYGRLGYGLLADFDAIPDVEGLAAHLQTAIGALAAGAGLPPSSGVTKPRRRRAGVRSQPSAPAAAPS
jgi:hypothetical protein